MILTKRAIYNAVHDNKIEISPFAAHKVNNNSYTVSLGSKLLRYTDIILDTAKKNNFREITISDGGMILEKGHFYIGHIAEYIGSDYYVPMLHGINNIAKRGLFIHVTANLIDIGNHCNFSLQLFPTENVYVYPGMEIAQVSFWKTSGRIKLYKGKYKNVVGPAASQSYKHMEKE